MATDVPAQVALSFLDAINRHDLAALTAQMTVDHAFVSLSGDLLEGREAVREAWRMHFAAHPQYHVHLSQILVRDRSAVCFGRTTGSHAPDVKALSPTLWVADVRDGLVAGWHVAQDTEENRAALHAYRGRSAWLDTHALAREVATDLRALTVVNTPNRDRVRSPYYRRLKTASARQVVELAFILLEELDERSTAHCVLEHHRDAMSSLREPDIERLGQGINSWWSVDGFAAYVAGVAWREGQIGDEVIHRWARSPDRWWRRAALVCTVALNTRARGGRGDVARTLQVCRLLLDDRDDMVVKAMSWALRECVFWDREAVQGFLVETEGRLAARARREVRNKLETGLKNPRRRSRSQSNTPGA